MSGFLSLAVRNITRNRRRSGITLVAIFLGVAVALLLTGFAEGFVRLMIEDVVEGRTGAIQIHRKGFMENVEASPVALNFELTDELRKKILAVPHVKGLSGRIAFNGLVGNGRAQTMFAGRALDVVHEKEACERSGADVKDGAALTDKDYATALIGHELAQAFGGTVGGTMNVQASSPDGRSNSMDVRVGGTTVSNFPFENKRVVAVPLELAQDLLGLPGRVTELVVGVDDIAEIDPTAAALRSALGDEYEVHTWRELQPFVRDIIFRQRVVLSGIAVVLFVIVITGIINTMLMSVFERVREIGTMLAVGMRRRQVLTLFLLEAAVLGVLGGVFGAAAGRAVLFAMAAEGIDISLSGTSGKNVLHPSVPWSLVVVAVVTATLGALVSAAYPAWKASRLNPVDALRST